MKTIYLETSLTITQYNAQHWILIGSNAVHYT